MPRRRSALFQRAEWNDVIIYWHSSSSSSSGKGSGRGSGRGSRDDIHSCMHWIHRDHLRLCSQYLFCRLLPVAFKLSSALPATATIAFFSLTLAIRIVYLSISSTTPTS